MVNVVPDMILNMIYYQYRKNNIYSENALKLEKGILLNFNSNDIPISLNIFDDSKLFNIPKFNLKNIKMSVSINKTQFYLYIIKK
jgi:hypothetical protein